MCLYERFILGNVRIFQNVTTEEKQKHLTLFGHKYLSMWLAYNFIGTIYPFVISFILLGIDIALCCKVRNLFSCIFIFINLALIVFFHIIEIIIIYKFKYKKNTMDEVVDWMIEKFQNLWLLNWHVISFIDWINIKRNNRELYEMSRSAECDHKCYYISYLLANTLRNPDIKIVWMCIKSLGKCCGHAVLQKDNRIYDSNLRRTFKREKYMEAFEVKVFREYSISEYLNKVNLDSDKFTFLDWEEFGKWCEKQNVVRSNDD